MNARHFETAEELARVTEVNAQKDYLIATGYSSPYPDGTMPLGGMNFELNDLETDPERNETEPLVIDLKRTVAEIREARCQADIVVVSVHTHEMRGRDTMVPPEFLETFAHACVDAGASAVIGHGPHQLRGLEIYKGAPVFYSIGNFIFETETVERQPADAFLGKGMPADTKVGADMDARSMNGTRGYIVDPHIWEAVVPEWTVADGRVRDLVLYHVTLGQKAPRSERGLPRLAEGDEAKAILSHLKDLSGTLRDENPD
ncbi:MAG: CapA family protein [Dakarella massiliensis]